MNPVNLNQANPLLPFSPSRWGSLMVCCIMAFNSMLAQQPSADEEDDDYPQFEIIAERNIFNPNRSARSAAPEPQVKPEAPVRSESIALLGTLIYEQKRLAFFDGSDSQYRQVLKPEETIAGYTIADIAWNRVTLKNGDHKIDLQVGTQLKREGEGDWIQSGRADPSNNRKTSAPAETGTSGGGDEEVDDVLKRLMQKRAQEMNP